MAVLVEAREMLSRDLIELADGDDRCDGARRVPEAIELSALIGNGSAQQMGHAGTKRRAQIHAATRGMREVANGSTGSTHNEP